MPNNPPNAMPVDFNAKQREFAAYIRNPGQNPAPADVPTERVAMYRELFFNNIDNFLSGNFPVIRAILDDQQWSALAQDFFANHVSSTPYFSEIPEEFIRFLQEERNNADDLPFLLELAHYEWVEMALSIAKEQLAVNPETIGNLPDSRIQLSPLAWPLAYQYPVHQISPAFLPSAPPAQATCLIVYRNLQDDVGFLEISPMIYALLTDIQNNPGIEIADCLAQITANLPHTDPDTIRAGCLNILSNLAEKNIVHIIA